MTFDALLAAIPFVLLVLVGLTHLAQLSAGTTSADLTQLFERFLPPHETTPGQDPFAVVERFLAGFSRARGTVSLYAAPLFLWFATRLFASIRTALTLVYDARIRAPGHRVILAYLTGKLRDAAMVLVTVLLFVGNTVLSAGVRLLNARSSWTGLGHLLAVLLALAFSVSLFYVTYRHASPRRLSRAAALAASGFTALLFELAKRLFGWYLQNVAVLNRFSTDANLGALILFVLWIYYTALVFLVGAVVAETWDLRARQRRDANIRPPLTLSTPP